MSCSFCNENALYGCSVCDNVICSKHAQMSPICVSHIKKSRCDYSIGESTKEEEEEIKQMINSFWGEPEQLTFGRRYTIEDLPAFTAKSAGHALGFLSYAELGTDLLIVALGILPKYQGAGIGRSLMLAVEDKARAFSKKRILVSTSNDNLMALAFYQSLGFQIFEVKPDVIAEKHGAVFLGIGGIPIRDELRLKKTI